MRSFPATSLRLSLTGLIITLSASVVIAQKVDYSVVSVPEEGGLELTKISKNSDYVCLPEVRRNINSIQWFSNRVIAMVPGKEEIAYLSNRNNSTNIFIKDANHQGASRQRTSRTGVIDFSFSPDGKQLYFSEKRAGQNQLFRTDASTGFVCRQITGDGKDYSPIVDMSGEQVFFTRAEKNGTSIWSYNLKNNFLSSFTTGYNPAPAGKNTIIVARNGGDGRSEIWRINYETGEEECIVSDSERSFTTPLLSPDGQWLLFVGSSKIQDQNISYRNTDIYVSRLDGSELRQLTHHAADDLSPIWSNDGRYIYFVSQRGDPNAVANIWRMSFHE